MVHAVRLSQEQCCIHTVTLFHLPQLSCSALHSTACNTPPPSSLASNAVWTNCASRSHGGGCTASRCNTGYMGDPKLGLPSASCELGQWILDDGACVGECDAARRLVMSSYIKLQLGLVNNRRRLRQGLCLLHPAALQYRLIAGCQRPSSKHMYQIVLYSVIAIRPSQSCQLFLFKILSQSKFGTTTHG